jgi:hypothetical protein
MLTVDIGCPTGATRCEYIVDYEGTLCTSWAITDLNVCTARESFDTDHSRNGADLAFQMNSDTVSICSTQSN